MINWETLAAASVCLTALCGLFIYIVRGIVGDAIHKAINGFDKRLSLIEKQQEDDRRDYEQLYTYAHTVFHDTMNLVANAQLEAFRAGRTAGLLSKQGD